MKLFNKCIFIFTVFLCSYSNCSIFNLPSIGDIGLSSVKSKISRATQLALNYAVFNKTLSFKEINDFSGEGESFLSYTLPPGSALKLFCGTKETRKSGLISLYPPDVINNSLAPMSKGGINESLGRVIKNFDLFRSDHTLIHSTSEWLGGSFMYQHPFSSVIVSKDLNFTLNIACVYNPNVLNQSSDSDSDSNVLDPNAEKKSENLLYRWIQIKFTNVMPISYGCGSGNYPLFSNLSPVRNALDLRGPPLQTSHSCEITPEPGMIIGIYCNKDETFDEDSCFRDSSLKTYYDPNFEFTNAPGRLHLFKVPDSGFDIDVSFHCRCKDKKNEPTAEVKIFKPSVFVCDFTKVFENLQPNQKLTLQSCRHELHPGESVRLLAPLNYTVFFYLNKKYLSVLEPNEVRDKTYVQSINSSQVTLSKVDDVIVSKGFSIDKVDVRGRIEYIFNYRKDSVLIHKTENVSLTYYWTMMKKRVNEREVADFITANERIFGIVNIGLVPTDPYTFGCGIRNEFFKNEFVDFKTTSENNKIISRCTVDANKGPIGFYCPSPFLLEPRSCFKSVIVTRTKDDGEVVEEVRELGKVLKNGRSHKSTNLVILEVYKNMHNHSTDATSSDPSSPSYEADESNFDSLMCKCMDSDGNVVASITVVNPNLSPVEEPPQDPENAEPSQPSGEDIGEIKTIIQ